MPLLMFKSIQQFVYSRKIIFIVGRKYYFPDSDFRLKIGFLPSATMEYQTKFRNKRNKI